MSSHPVGVCARETCNRPKANGTSTCSPICKTLNNYETDSEKLHRKIREKNAEQDLEVLVRQQEALREAGYWITEYWRLRDEAGPIRLSAKS